MKCQNKHWLSRDFVKAVRELPALGEPQRASSKQRPGGCDRLDTMSSMNPPSDQDDHLLATARLLATRLERLSADSTCAHRASGCRGALLKLMEEIETAPVGQAPDWDRLAFLVGWGFDLLEEAARQIAA